MPDVNAKQPAQQPEAPVQQPQPVYERPVQQPQVQPAYQPQPAAPVQQRPVQPKAKSGGSVLWWILAGAGLLLLIASLVFLFFRFQGSKVQTEDWVYVPTYVEPVTPEPDPEPTDDPWAEPGPTDTTEPADPDDWNADGQWSLDAAYLTGVWVSDFYDDNTVECLIFGEDGAVQLWEGIPGSGDTIDTWFDGNWEQNLLYSGSYWTDGDYLTLYFDEWENSITYGVDMTGLFDFDLLFDDGSRSHFEQVA